MAGSCPRLIVVASISIASVWITSCADGELIAYVDDKGTVAEILLPDEQRLDRSYDLDATLEEWSSRRSPDDLDIRFEPARTAYGESHQPLSVRLKIESKDLLVRLSFEAQKFPPIVRRTCSPLPLPDRKLWHAGLMFKYYQGPMKEVQPRNTHIIFWYDDATGRPCWANYTCRDCRGDDEGAAGTRMCTSTCGPGYRDLVNTLALALTAYVSAETARLIAQIAAPIIFGATLAPVVPPPP